MELTGDYIVILLFIEIAKIKLSGGRIGIMLFIEIAKLELTGGHIGINRRKYWIYANFRVCQKRNNRRPNWN